MIPFWVKGKEFEIQQFLDFSEQAQYIKQYLTFEDGFIYRNSLFPKKIKLNSIKIFKKFAGEYIIETDQTKLRIDTTLIEQDSLIELNKTLTNYR